MLEGLLLILVDLLLNDVLLQHLVIELERFLLDEVVIEAFAVSWLDNVTLGVDAVLVADLRGSLMLALEFLFLLHSVRVVLDETPCGRNIKL